MRILFLLYVYLLVLDSEGTVSVPAPENLKVVSNNFIHILEWSPGKGTRPGTVYNVNVRNNQVRNITGTSTDISKYMTDKYLPYIIRLWASYDESSSSKAKIQFSPYTNTVIGPPELSLSGCGDCLNISIDLPNRLGSTDTFYDAIEFDIHWRKASDRKDGCHNPFTDSQSTKSAPYSYVLLNLQPGERYCVRAQPRISSLPEQNLLNSCSCEFTSRIEHRGVAFLAGWVASSILVGLSFLTFVFFLVYTGFLCKPNVRLPKALMVLVPGFLLSPEETCLSVAEVEYGVQIHKPEDQQKKKKEGNEEQGDDEDDDDDERLQGYMDRAVPSETDSTGNVRSAPDREAAENSQEERDFEEAPTHAADTLLLSRVRYSAVEAYSLGATPELVPKTSPSFGAREEKRLEGEMKKEVTQEDSGNVNLWSVVLKSMQPEEERVYAESRDAAEPLLPSSGKEVDTKTATPQTGSSTELHTALLFHAQTDTQSGQDQENELSGTGVCDHTQTGYMASHTGTIDTEDCSDEDEDDCMSGYMSR